MQALVIAHAAYGHNSFFKGNYLFRLWTDASSIIDYLRLRPELHRRVRRAPRHAGGRGAARLLPRAAEPRRRPLPPARQALARRGEGAQRRPRGLRPEAGQRHVAHAAQAARTRGGERRRQKRFPAEPQENLLYFIEKNAPLLEPWQREIVRIVRKIAQYFYPQRQTQVMNEGWATFWHHHLLNTMYDDGHLTDGVMIECAEVAHQRGLPAAGRPPRLQRHQPLCARLRDVHRHQAHLREADRRGPRVVSRPRRHAWLPALDYAMRNFKDESFIGQYLSPQLMRDFRLFAILDDEASEHLRSRRSTTTRATATCARRCRTSTT